MLSSTSGAAKKRKQKEIAESNAKLPKITNFLVAQNTNNSCKNSENTTNETTITCVKEVEIDIPLTSDSQSYILENTDLGNFKDTILTDDLKKKIIFSQSCRPMGPFPRDPLQNNRKFSKNYYQRQTKHGCIERFWLCY